MLTFFEKFDVSLQISDFRVLEQFKSEKQDIIVLLHPKLGKILLINNEIQHVESWTVLYHEPLIHLPAAFITEVKKVLILGGGSLFSAQEVLKYSSVEEVTMIEHDPMVINIISKHYNHSTNVLNDSRLRIIFQDAYSNIEGKYDLIINDCVDLLNHSNIDLFYLLIDKLSDNGICADVIYRHIFEKEHNLSCIKKLQDDYYTIFSLLFVPEYPGILHLLSLWSKTNTMNANIKFPINNIQKKWLKKPSTSPCLYYNPAFINYYLYLPPYIKKELNTPLL